MPVAQQSGRDLLFWWVFLFVLLDTSKSLSVSWTAVRGNMCAPLVVCTKNVLSIIFGVLVSAALNGFAGVKQCLDLTRGLRMLPVACAFCAAQLMGLEALRVFDAGSLKVLAQINLPATTLLSWLFLNRRYSARQWYAMALLFIASMAFLQVRVLFYELSGTGGQKVTQRDLDRNNEEKTWGTFCILSGILLSSMASICAERFLKTRYDLPFYIQKTNLMFGELFCSCLLLHLRTERGSGCSWEILDVYRDWRQMLVILIWFVHGWIAGLLVKRCSALTKNVSHILSALVTYFLPLILVWDTDAHCWPVTLSALLVLAAVLVFAFVPPEKKKDMRHQSSEEAPKQVIARSASEVNVKEMISQQKGKQMIARESRKPGAAGGSDIMPSKHYVQKLELERNAPKYVVEDVSLWAPMCSVHSVAFLTFCFILLDATKPILVSWAHQRKAPHETFISGTFILVQTSLSLGVGLVIATFRWLSPRSYRVGLHSDWRGRVLRCLNPSCVVQQLPVSFCLCVSKLCLVMSLERLDAGTVRVFGQSSLPLVAVTSALFFSRRYSAQQWCSLVAISLALVAFYLVKAEVVAAAIAESAGSLPGRSHHNSIQVAGVMFILTSITFNCLGALLVEKFLKQDRGELHEQKAHLLVGEIAINALLLIGTHLFFSDRGIREIHSPWHRGFFAGWDHRVLILALVWIPAGWTATMLVKRCSNLLKTVSQCTSAVLTYVFSVFPVTLVGPPLQPEPLSSPVVLLAIAVMMAALSFGADAKFPSGSAGRQNGNWIMDPAYRQLQGQLLRRSGRDVEISNGGRTHSAGVQ